MAVTTVARVRTVFTGVAGSPAYSNLYFDATSADAGVYQTSVLDALDANSGAISSGVTMTMVNPIPIINVLTGQVVDVAIGDGGTTLGTSAGELLPPATNGLLQVHTGQFVGGREIRGRMFWPYPTEGSSDNGVPISDYIATLAAFAAQLQGISGANGAWVVYSRAHARAEYITSWSGWNEWASLRSRRD